MCETPTLPAQKRESKRRQTVNLHPQDGFQQRRHRGEVGVPPHPPPVSMQASSGSGETLQPDGCGGGAPD